MNPRRFLIALSVVLCALLPVACSEEPVYACDLFSNGKCTLKPGDVYDVPAAQKPVVTWTDFSHHLYFHSKITPGLRVRKSAIKEMNNMKAGVCHYRLSDPRRQLIAVEGELEGFRVDDDGIWCFDYFGSQLLHFVRANDIAEEKVDMALFPLELEIHLNSQGPSVRRLIQLSGWQP
ncbi:MAG: hypothetical protein CVV45_19435 [Spirochaetae bacterium HGW-Spirochaetae-10]|nr:MAG: hypothetical protein CVV45_19435 [Spirochaetae bacterium HGW-Spirochaetae-10]